MNTKRNPKTESGKRVINDLLEKGYPCNETDTIAIIYEERETTCTISYNFCTTNLKYKLSDLNKDDLVSDDIKNWPYWSHNFKA